MKGEMRKTKTAMMDERMGEKGRQDENFQPGTCGGDEYVHLRRSQLRRSCVSARAGKRDAHPRLIVDGITLDMAVVVNKLEAAEGGGERLDEATGRDGGEGEDGREGSDAKNAASSWRRWSSASLAALLVCRIGARASAERALRWARKWGDRVLSLCVKRAGAEVGNDLVLDVVRAGVERGRLGGGSVAGARPGRIEAADAPGTTPLSNQCQRIGHEKEEAKALASWRDGSNSVALVSRLCLFASRCSGSRQKDLKSRAAEDKVAVANSKCSGWKAFTLYLARTADESANATVCLRTPPMVRHRATRGTVDSWIRYAEHMLSKTGG
ncbi:hypothetical protein B0H14DRAFT_2562634 [Mycena olivaceomarginata]|nr:hypothetical protein B0H14DRAFT_2562634 [Mycena olivaceomarginata]